MIFIRKTKVIEVFYILAKTVSVILGVVSFAMLLRMLLPFFVNPMESRIYEIVFFITEPFITPVREVMIKMNIGQDSPIDWAFSVSYIIIWLLRNLLPAI
jgi:uncharacterized protein YggT (Ycf19 family)